MLHPNGKSISGEIYWVIIILFFTERTKLPGGGEGGGTENRHSCEIWSACFWELQIKCLRNWAWYSTGIGGKWQYYVWIDVWCSRRKCLCHGFLVLSRVITSQKVLEPCLSYLISYIPRIHIPNRFPCFHSHVNPTLCSKLCILCMLCEKTAKHLAPELCWLTK